MARGREQGNLPNDVELQRLIEDYTVIKDHTEILRTPEKITNLWRAIWQMWGEKAGIMPAVTSLRTTQAELAEIEKEGRMFIYLPHELTFPGKNKYLLLDRMFPDTNTNLLKNPSTEDDEYHRYGWIDIEASIETPYSLTTADELIRLFDSQNRLGQRLSTYIIGSQFSKLITGKYFDEEIAYPAGNEYVGSLVTGPEPGDSFLMTPSKKQSRSRLLGTYSTLELVSAVDLDNRVKHHDPLEVAFNPNGHLSGGIGNTERIMHVGGRSEGIKFSLSL